MCICCQMLASSMRGGGTKAFTNTPYAIGRAGAVAEAACGLSDKGMHAGSLAASLLRQPWPAMRLRLLLCQILAPPACPQLMDTLLGARHQHTLCQTQQGWVECAQGCMRGPHLRDVLRLPSSAFFSAISRRAARRSCGRMRGFCSLFRSSSELPAVPQQNLETASSTSHLQGNTHGFCDLSRFSSGAPHRPLETAANREVSYRAACLASAISSGPLLSHLQCRTKLWRLLPAQESTAKQPARVLQSLQVLL